MYCTDMAYINTDTRTPYRDIALSVTYWHYIKTAMLLLINESIIMLNNFICCICLMIHNTANALKYSVHRLGFKKNLNYTIWLLHIIRCGHGHI